jgi:tRNA threonylcarbamoyladenosine biosynthesis protein TsaE
MTHKSIEITTQSAAETVALGQRLGAALKGGEVIALIGNLGTGKTHLIKGIAHGLGVQEDDLVTSPTFVLVNEYFAREGALQVYHIDAYRLESAAEFEALGIEEYSRPDSIVLVEWADRVMDAVSALKPIIIRLSHEGGDVRTIAIENLPKAIS